MTCPSIWRGDLEIQKQEIAACLTAIEENYYFLFIVSDYCWESFWDEEVRSF